MDSVDPSRVIFAFTFVLALIGLLALALKYFGQRLNMPFAKASSLFASDDNTRIKLVETRYIDTRRRLMLVRRDNTEHLLLIAEGRELLIESFPAKDEAAQKGPADAA